MSVILNIDTSLDIAYISIAKNGEVIKSVSNTEQKDHGGFLQPAIKALLTDADISIADLDAIAIAAGPGSYTGLRVGMASAKGLCYALKKPLITVGTLEILAHAAMLQYSNDPISSTSLLCPMIDARRMEVFTALYDLSIKPVIDPCAMVLDENSFANSLLKNQVLFFGNGASKWKLICRHEKALFIQVFNNPLAMSNLAHAKFKHNDFANLAYSEPLYLKEFFGAI
jgi:tRNA threonylcarbamoyladenosine biosynthesis protein TsaB